jgi:hypothetical protein
LIKFHSGPDGEPGKDGDAGLDGLPGLKGNRGDPGAAILFGEMGIDGAEGFSGRYFLIYFYQIQNKQKLSEYKINFHIFFKEILLNYCFKIKLKWV